MSSTHEVLNQATPLSDYDAFARDRALTEAVEREGAGWALEKLGPIGRWAGSAEAIAWGVQANKHTPELRTFDRYGHRIDEVEFHPAWHALMKAGTAAGLHAQPWREPRPGAHVARAAAFFLMAQAEAGFNCPMSMTYAAVPALRANVALAAEWEPRFTSLEYDSRFIPATEKRGALCGMAMTEKQGGSDVRANTTRAVPIEGGSGHFAITGHKWFCSAPMCDAFLTLAQTARGLSCFLLPRFTPEGKRNRFYIQRLKDKLGNRSNASSEIELDGAFATLIGEEGRGVPTIIEMVMHTRLDCCIGAAANLRLGATWALHHTRHRSAFGRPLVEQPLMQNVLADLILESEAATAVMARLARGYDESPNDEAARRWTRLCTAIGKYWLCKRAPAHTAEALECLGGNGFVEESMMPRLYREAPLNSIWEGSGNVICLDVLRAMAKDPESVQLFFDEVRGHDPALDRAADSLLEELGDFSDIESRARRVVERMAILLSASLLKQNAPAAVSDAFLRSRLEGDRGLAFGTLPASVDSKAIIERAGF